MEKPTNIHLDSMFNDPQLLNELISKVQRPINDLSTSDQWWTLSIGPDPLLNQPDVADRSDMEIARVFSDKLSVLFTYNCIQCREKRKELEKGINWKK